MKLTAELIEKGFGLHDVADADLAAWQENKTVCFRDYVDRWYGGWDDAQQLRLNEATFAKSRQLSCLKRITLGGETVGFLGFDEQQDRIDGLLIHMIPRACGQGFGSWFLREVTVLGKPVHLKVFKDNPARSLYERHGFEVCGETATHYLMKTP